MRSQDQSKPETRFTSAARKAKALGKLGVSSEQVASATQITPLLKDQRGSLKPVLLAMYLSQDPVVQCFLAKLDSLGVWARENTSWEAVGLAAGIDLLHLLGAALLARQQDATTRAKLIAICNAPEVMKKRIEYALMPAGWRDRDAIDKLLGLL